MPQIKFSVVICTYNRADILPVALKSVLDQDYSRENYELIVVDNASSDNTRQVVDGFAAQYSNVRYCLEVQVGLSQARNRGWQEARGSYVGYVDDDCKMPSQWLVVAAELVLRGGFDAFGGPYYAFYDSPKPKWFKDEYGSHVRGLEERLLGMREYLDGGNMFIRRETLQALGGFKTDFGLNGEQVVLGEEIQLFHRLREENPGARIFYDPSLFVYHLVKRERMRLFPMIRRNFRSGQDYCRANVRTQSGIGAAVKAFMLDGIRLCLLLMVSPWRNRDLYPYLENYFYEVIFVQITRLGCQYQTLRQAVSGAV